MTQGAVGEYLGAVRARTQQPGHHRVVRVVLAVIRRQRPTSLREPASDQGIGTGSRRV